jgi:hypothetical protein
MPNHTHNIDWETSCPARPDGRHCEHWYDADPCCACGDPADTHNIDNIGITLNNMADTIQSEETRTDG